MEFILVIIALVVAFVICSWVIWPTRTLWWLLKYTHKQNYTTSFYHVNYVPEDAPAVILSTHTNLFVATLVRSIAKQKVTIAIQNYKCKSKLVLRLLKKSNIHVISVGQISTWDLKGVLVIHQCRYDIIADLNLPIIPLDVCGFEHIRHEKGANITQLLHLSFSQALDASLVAKARKDLLGNYNIHAWDHHIAHLSTIPELWIQQARARKNEIVIADSTGVELSGHKMLTAVLTMSKKLEPFFLEQPRIGICLPPSVGGSMAMMCVMMQGKTMVNLNYTASHTALNTAIKEAEIKTIVTSGRFIEQLKKKGFFLEDVFSACNILLLEDIKQQIDKLSLLKNLIRVKIKSAKSLIESSVNKVSIDHEAAILFSSGSEGKPKGIVLTHKNIIGNVKQSMMILDARASDSIISILPIFHVFGITATTLLPLIEGLFYVCHPDPTDAQTLGELSVQYKPTILCGTSTFFRLYTKNRQLTKETFKSYRMVVAGAEKLQNEVRSMFENKFEKEIHEGYGTTELSPVASANEINTEDEIRNHIGTVGKCIPGARVMIIDPTTKEELPIGEAGMITFGGVNVMQGYLHDPEKTDEVIFTRDKIRWYQTGDKGVLDDEGYLTIQDRYSRFAKLGGEMVSLFAVEDEIIKLLGENEEYEILAVATPDIKKGEKITLLYNFDMSEDDIKMKIRQSEMNNLMKPTGFIKVEEIPKLGTGKTDFSAAKKAVLDVLTG
jgi:acyl-[acyl-carrier-protein]-phospholipid O-acyltransferase / long-chain-fatty-acid--[acyl-carrier-protein] ligase